MYKHIPIEEKVKLSKIIQYYREAEEFQNAASFPIDASGEAICSPWTLTRLESGEIIEDDTIYLRLLNKLSKTYRNDPELNEDIHQITSEMRFHQDSGDPEEFKNHLHRLYEILLPYQSYVLEELYLHAVRLMISYHDQLHERAGELNFDHAYQTYQLFDIFDKDFQAILQPVLYALFQESKLPEELDLLIRGLHLEESSSVKSKLIYVNYLIRTRRFYLIPILLESAAEYYAIHPSAEREIEILESRVHFNMLTRSSDFRSSLSLLITRFEQDKVHLQTGMIPVYLYNIASFLWEAGEIDRSAAYFLESLQCPGGHTIYAAMRLLYFHSIYNHPLREEALRFETDLANFSEEINKNYAAIFAYYRLKAEGADADRLEKLITNEVFRSYQRTHDEKMYEVFALELESLTAKTGHRHLLDLYRKSRHKSRQPF